MSTQRLIRDVLRWARANDWRPLHPRKRRDGLYSWTNAVPDPGNRQQSTLRVLVDMSGVVEVHQRMTDGWVAIGWFRVGAGRVAINVLSAMGCLPKEFSAAYRSGSDTMTAVARSNKRHVATLTAVVGAAYDFADHLDCGNDDAGERSMHARRLREALDAAKPAADADAA